MFRFDIVVTETTLVELEVDPAVADTYCSDSDEEYGVDLSRTFLDNQGYLLPIDQLEGKRLDHQHEMLKIAMDDKIYWAPIQPNEIKHVLDIGTGHGQWAVEFATTYPNTEVIGTDLVLPERESVPENCRFVISDAEKPWDFPHKFDFIHLRDLMICFKDQKEVFKSAFDALEPGGYCQILDGKLPLDAIDSSLEGTSIEKWLTACVEAGEACGRPWTNIPKYREWLNDIGFEDVIETVFHHPISDWAIGTKEKKMGAMMLKDVKLFLYSSRRLLIEVLKWDEAKVDALLVETMKDSKDRNIHAYIPIYVLWGRKPLVSE